MATFNTQNFEGEINEYGLGATPEMPILQGAIRDGDELKIPKSFPPDKDFGNISGQPVVAVLELGGSQSHEPSRVDVARIDDPEDADILALAHRQRIDTRRPDQYMLTAFNEKGSIAGIAFIKNLTRFNLLGREGNIEWIRIDYSQDKETPQHWTPFDENPSVSREQLILSCEDKDLTIRGISKNSRTNFKTFITPEQREALQRNRTATEEVKIAGRGLMRLFKKA
jgi:hypothetical protein